MSANAIRCIGGPLDGKDVDACGETMLHARTVKPDFGEMIAFGAPSVAHNEVHKYRQDTFDGQTFYVHVKVIA